MCIMYIMYVMHICLCYTYTEKQQSPAELYTEIIA